MALRRPGVRGEWRADRTAGAARERVIWKMPERTVCQPQCTRPGGIRRGRGGPIAIALLAVVFCLRSALAGEPASGGESPPAQRDVARLVRELAADDWAVREAASAGLRQVGAPALPALREAAKSSDLEVRVRAQELVASIERDQLFSKLGNTLIAETYGNRVVEVDRDGAEVWVVAVPGGSPLSARRLPGGKTLVGCADGGKALIFDRDKKVVWETTVPGRLFCAEALDNGNLLVSYCEGDAAADGKIVEINPDKKVVWETKAKSPRGCRRLPNGHTLLVENLPGRVREVDREGKTVWQAEGLKEPWSAARLENGNTLVAENSPGRVRELDKDGKEVWSYSEGLTGPTCALRLGDGHTLIADYQGKRVVELDRDRKVFWEHKCPAIIASAQRLESAPQQKKPDAATSSGRRDGP
jgi:hypothetical protein